MAKTIPSKSTGTSKVVPGKETIDTAAFAFGKENYILLVISVVLVIIGYILMSGGKSTDPNVFSDKIFDFQRITLAPIVVLIGYSVGVYAIVKKVD